MADISTKPLTVESWDDFVELMGPKGGCGGCWCMLWRLPKRDHDALGNEGNRAAIRSLVTDGDTSPGLLAYERGRAVGWIALAPRGDYIRLETSRVLAPVDELPVWSISCFLIAKDRRRQGIAQTLLAAAGDFVRDQGGKVLEGYPIEPTKSPYPVTYAWTGFKTIFDRAGFTEVLRRSETRPIMRKILTA